MQPVTGPSGPPVAGPSGAPDVAGPSGPPVSGPSGPPTDVNPAQFDPLAEIEDARARRQNREDRLEMLEKKRNSARINVYLFLAVTVILGIFSFFPGPIHGDVSDDPQAGMGSTDAKDWIRDSWQPTPRPSRSRRLPRLQGPLDGSWACISSTPCT